MRKVSIVLVLLVSLSACGQKGPLEPPEPASFLLAPVSSINSSLK